jgi:glycine oxidase
VGGGLIGLSVAWRLAQAGFSVSIFDRGSFGREASWAGAGMLAPGGEVEESSDFAKRTLASRALYRSFVRELEDAASTKIDYQECGALDLAYSSAEWHALQERAARQNALGIISKPLDSRQITIFWPRVRSAGLGGALFYPDDAIVDPRELVAALLVACRDRGVPLFAERTVDRLEILRNEAILHTAGGPQRFQAVVIAAGAWSSSIPVTGVPPIPAAEPVKGHLIGYQQPAQTCNTIVRRGHTYLLQRANGLLIAGASVEHAGWDRTIDLEIASDLAQQAGSLLPHLAETNPTEIWTGFRPASEALQIGPWHTPVLHLAYGHYRNGILLAPWTAKEIAAQLSASFQTR